METVSIVIPTLNRQKSLQRALASVRAQADLDGATIEIVVVDNSRDASARETVAALDVAGWPVHYLSEPAPGVATARNAGVRAAQGRWIAFLDDDEEARPDWIAEMLRVARATGAQAVFGPVEARADDAGEIGGFAPYFSRAIERADGDDITELSAYLGTNNSMFERALCLSDGAPFEESLNEIGGEDSLLLERLTMNGCRRAGSIGPMYASASSSAARSACSCSAWPNPAAPGASPSGWSSVSCNSFRRAPRPCCFVPSIARARNARPPPLTAASARSSGRRGFGRPSTARA
jgi:hypothetical protein